MADLLHELQQYSGAIIKTWTRLDSVFIPLPSPDQGLIVNPGQQWCGEPEHIVPLIGSERLRNSVHLPQRHLAAAELLPSFNVECPLETCLRSSVRFAVCIVGHDGNAWFGTRSWLAHAGTAVDDVHSDLAVSGAGSHICDLLRDLG